MPFSKLIGNTLAKDVLQRMLELQAVPSTLLFAGPEGVGKTLFAKEFAILLLGEVHRHKIERNIHPDVKVLSTEGKMGLHAMSSIRQVIEEASLAPFESKARVFILEDAERMLPSSSNALLKTLEEPEDGNYFLLVSSRPEEMLPTLLSRSRRISFSLIAEKEICDVLKTKRAISDLEAKKIAMLSHGSITKAYELLEKVDSPLRHQLLEILSHPKLYEEYSKLLSALQKLESLCVASSEEEDFSISDAEHLLSELFYWYRDLYLLSLEVSSDYVFHFDQITALSEIRDPLLPLEKIFLLVEECRFAMQRSTKIKTVFEYFFSRLYQMSPSNTLEKKSLLCLK